MIDYKELAAYLGIAMTTIAILPYIWNVYVGKIRPHAFSWIIWSLLTGIAFVIQMREGAGVGGWLTGVTSLLCFVVFGLALWKGERTFTFFDWIVLLLATLTIIIWQLTSNPLLSIFLAATVDGIGYIPTFKKGYFLPFEESAFIFGIDVVKWILALIALERFVLVTALYPAYIIVINSGVVAMLLLRRRQLTTGIQN